MEEEVRKEEKNKGGRPTIYTPELSSELCVKLARGESLRTACKDPDMPCMTTVFRWLSSNVEFREQYEKAKQESADAMAEEILDIADDGTNDWEEKMMQSGEVKIVLNTEHVQRSRLRVDARKWLMAKMKPKRYGDKLDVTSDGEKIGVPMYLPKRPDDTDKGVEAV